MHDAAQCHELGMKTARALADAADHEWPDIVSDLLAQRQLSTAVHQMNRLLAGTDTSSLAATALKRMGLGWDI